MSHPRDPIDVYAETQVLDPQAALDDRGAGQFALYDEYVRELESSSASKSAAKAQGQAVRSRR